jgi:DNA-binding SARP family transcriptional activator/WD40 repeat protein
MLLEVGPAAPDAVSETGVNRYRWDNLIDAAARSGESRGVGIAVLGPLSFDGDGTFGRRDRAVLTALAMCVGRSVTADQLADAVWGETPPATAHKALQGCMVRLRKTLGAETIETSPQGYRLVLPAEDVDFRRFERMVGRGRELLALGEPERAAFVLSEALELWRGRAFEDVETWDLALVEAGRLDELRLEAEELRVDAALRAGRHPEVLGMAEAMVRAAPLRERRWTLLALAQYQAERQSEALGTIRRLKTVLAEQLGLDPGPELVALEEAILRQDESLLAGDPLVTSASCPYRGLTPYDVDDSETFFGREEDVRDCLELLRSHGSLAVVGPSGSGKSSLVRAGIAAALQRDGSSVVVITPGEHPMQPLGAVSEAPAGSVLLVDQCEEAFSLADASERSDFFAGLVRWTEHGPLVLAMRADRLTDASAYSGFARLLERSLHLLGAMSEQGLRDAVESPARQAGLLIEPGLVDLLVGEVEGTPGALPLLSHALLETWKRREGNTLTVAGYLETGGIRGAVAQSAEKVYATIDPQLRPVLRDLVLRLVTAGSEGEPVRARVPRRLLSPDPDHERLIDLLVGSRLVTSDAGVVEIAHEALANAWPRLRTWLDDDMEGLRIRHHLTAAADAWDSMGRPDSELYRGVRLEQALQWKARQDTTLTPAEAAFLETSEKNEESEQRAAEQRARSQARLIRRLRGVLAVATVLLVAALVAGGLAVQQQDEAQDNAAEAVTAQTAAEARRAGAQALVTDDISESMLLAVAGVQLDDSPETRSSLFAAMARHPELIESMPMAGDGVVDFDVSPDGQSIVTYDFLNHVRLYDLDNGRLLRDFQAGSKRALSWVSVQTKFSPDGQTLAVVMAAPVPRPVMLFDAETLEPYPVQPGGALRGRRRALDLTFSSDAHHLAASMSRYGDDSQMGESIAYVWDLRNPRQPTARLSPGTGTNAGLALSPDGSRLYSTDPFGTGQLTIHHIATGKDVLVPNPAGVKDMERIAMSPDGTVLASPADGGLLLLDPATGQLLRRLPGNGDTGFLPSFSADGSRVATVTFEKHEAVVWDLPSAAMVAQLPLAGGTFSSDLGDGSTLYTVDDRTLQQWDVDGERRFIKQAALVPPDIGDVGFARPSPGGDFIAFGLEDKVAFFDVAANRTGVPVDRGAGYADLLGGSWHPDGTHFALATDGEIRVWDARTNELVTAGSPSGTHVTGVDYSTDGDRLVIGELSGQVTMLEPSNLTPVAPPVRLDGAVVGVAAGPDNRTAIALLGFEDPSGFWSSSSTAWALVDLEAGEILDQGALEIDANVVDVSADGRHAAIGGSDGELLVLDLDSGEPVRPPESIQESVYNIAYSADGTRLLTSGGGSIGLWNGQTGELLARTATSKKLPTEAGFSSDPNSVLMAPLFGGPVNEWNTSIDEAIAYACRMAGRGFTEAEWAKEFGDRPYQETCPAG